ncbi:putative uncharacterized transposon-derived protein F52C9.6 [Varanus komodoensis]|nr:putative uncharacterized transposon-derived protein F52C9.6 [Varanus komodoensis]
MRKMDLQESKVGIKVGGRTINNLQYADDRTFLSETQEGLMQWMQRIKEESEKFSLLLNIQKMKILTNAQNEVIKIAVDNVEIECGGNVEEKFTFLGSLITHSGECSPEIKQQILLGRSCAGDTNKWETQTRRCWSRCVPGQQDNKAETHAFWPRYEIKRIRKRYNAWTAQQQEKSKLPKSKVARLHLRGCGQRVVQLKEVAQDWKDW